jgi:hypothetical protein
MFIERIIHKFLQLKTAEIFSCFLIVFNLGSPVVYSQGFRVFAVSDIVRVFEDGFNLPDHSDTLKLFGIRGETISGQFVIHSTERLENVGIKIKNPVDRVTGNAFPANSLEWNYVGSIPLQKNASNQPDFAVTRVAPARFPDYLMPDIVMNLNPGTFQAVWLTIRIPEVAENGSYSGNIQVISNKGNHSLPLVITVYPLNMPRERHLKVTEWYSTDDFEKLHGIKEAYSQEWFDMLRKYADNMTDHRQNVFQVPMSLIEIRKAPAGLLEFDFSLFDRVAGIFWDTGKMDDMETGELAKFGEGGFSSNEILFKDFTVKTGNKGEKAVLQGQEVIPSLLPAFENHLRQKGWLNKTYFHVKDEPSHHNALSWISASSLIHKYAPHLMRMDAVCTSFLFGNIEIAVPKLDHLDAGYEIYRKEQQKGAELWFYTVGIYQGSMYPNKTIDMPLIDSRILHWLNYKYDLSGYLHWGWNQWTGDPYTDPDIHLGDGWHVYPVKNGILNSLRWEQMRNGIQDYEYFWLLENKIGTLKDSLGAQFSWIDPRQRGKEIISQVAMGLKEHSDDPRLLYHAKMDVIREIMDFKNSPAIYLQTNPPEHGHIINRSVVELLGWTEPGTEIMVNGKKLSVAYDGLFMERYLIYKGDRLEIKAKNGKGEKTIIRDFNITY